VAANDEEGRKEERKESPSGSGSGSGSGNSISSACLKLSRRDNQPTQCQAQSLLPQRGVGLRKIGLGDETNDTIMMIDYLRERSMFVSSAVM
jgi:hypothetical protein